MVKIKIITPGYFVLNGMHFSGPAELIVNEKDIELIKRECAVHGIAYEIEQAKPAKKPKQEVKEVNKVKKEPETKAANESQTKVEVKKEPETKTEVAETEKPRRGRRKKA